MTKRLWTVVLAFTLACTGIFVGGIAAQEAAPPVTVATNPETPAETTMTLWQFWTVGGWCMWPLGAVNVASVALIVYGFLWVRDRKMLLPELIPGIQESLAHLRIDEATATCTQNPSMMTNVLHAGLQRISGGVLDVPAMEKAMEEASVEETQAGLRMINYISVSAQIAPMLGLLGTVSGMIKAFQKIGRGAMGKPELLANDIGEALITTAYGLIIGIPAMVFYFYLKSRYTANITRMGRLLGNLTHHLVSSARGSEPEAKPAE